MILPAYVKNCIDLLEAAGFSAYAVGGAVRDSLLGKIPYDWDLTTSATPEQTLAVFSHLKTVSTGIKHGTVTVLMPDEDKTSPIEITTFRIDGDYHDSRHPDSVEFSNNIIDDLSRRDFTINAMAFNERDGLIDAFSGLDDLKKKIIRTVGDPETRFSEDALRILRAFRFSAQLGFEIDADVLSGVKKCAHLLKNIARERIGAEFVKLISADGVEYSLNKMIESGAWESIFDLKSPDQDDISRLHELRSESFTLRLAAIMSSESAREVESALHLLRLSNDDKKRVLRLLSVKNFDLDLEGNNDLSALARRFLHFYGDILSDSIQFLHFLCGDRVCRFVAAVDEESKKANPLTVSSLAIRGNDILPLCNGNYSLVGRSLAFLLERVIDDPALNHKEKLLDLTKEYIEKSLS